MKYRGTANKYLPILLVCSLTLEHIPMFLKDKLSYGHSCQFIIRG